MTLNLIVPYGKVKFVFYSQKKNIFKVIEIGEKKYSRLTVPPKIWFGFQGRGSGKNLLVNIANMVHDPKEVIGKPKSDLYYDWEVTK